MKSADQEQPAPQAACPAACPRCARECNRPPHLGKYRCQNCGMKWVAPVPVAEGSFDGALGGLLAACRGLGASVAQLELAAQGGGVVRLSAAGLSVTHVAQTDEELLLGGLAKLERLLGALGEPGQ